MGKLYFPDCFVVLKPVLEFTDNESIVINARPIDLSIERNSFNKADSFSMTFDTRYLPISPAMIRSMGVEVYMYDRGHMESAKQITFADAKLGRVDPSGALATRPMIVGLIDDVSASFNNDGCEVTITGQDYTALFLEQKIPTHKNNQKIKRPNFYGQRLDVALEALLKEADRGGAMSLTVEIPFDRGLLPHVGVGQSKTNKKGTPVTKDQNYWDYMYNLALSHGFILFVRDLELVLAAPQSVFDASDNDPLRNYELTYGINVQDLQLSRKMGKETVPQVKVTCYNEDQRKTLVAVYPEKSITKTMGDGNTHTDQITMVLRGVKDEKILKQAAENIHRLMSSSELSMQLVTREMRDETDNNMLFITCGDSLKLKFNSYNSMELRAITAGEYSGYLQKQGFDSFFASLQAETSSKVDILKYPFYVKQASISWNNEDGFSATIEAGNYVMRPQDRP